VKAFRGGGTTNTTSTHGHIGAAAGVAGHEMLGKNMKYDPTVHALYLTWGTSKR